MSLWSPDRNLKTAATDFKEASKGPAGPEANEVNRGGHNAPPSGPINARVPSARSAGTKVGSRLRKAGIASREGLGPIRAGPLLTPFDTAAPLTASGAGGRSCRGLWDPKGSVGPVGCSGARARRPRARLRPIAVPRQPKASSSLKRQTSLAASAFEGGPQSGRRMTHMRPFRRMSFDRFRIGNDWQLSFLRMRDCVFAKTREAVADFEPG
jgi:hypothetical protein